VLFIVSFVESIYLSNHSIFVEYKNNLACHRINIFQEDWKKNVTNAFITARLDEQLSGSSPLVFSICNCIYNKFMWLLYLHAKVQIAE
jgi:hypothetical protein